MIFPTLKTNPSFVWFRESVSITETSTGLLERPRKDLHEFFAIVLGIKSPKCKYQLFLHPTAVSRFFVGVLKKEFEERRMQPVKRLAVQEAIPLSGIACCFLI